MKKKELEKDLTTVVEGDTDVMKVVDALMKRVKVLEDKPKTETHIHYHYPSYNYQYIPHTPAQPYYPYIWYNDINNAGNSSVNNCPMTYTI